MFWEWNYIGKVLKCFSLENYKPIKIPLIKGMILGEELCLTHEEKGRINGIGLFFMYFHYTTMH